MYVTVRMLRDTWGKREWEAAPDAPVSPGTLALTKNGSQKRVKNSVELTKLEDTDAPQKG